MSYLYITSFCSKAVVSLELLIHPPNASLPMTWTSCIPFDTVLIVTSKQWQSHDHWLCNLPSMQPFPCHSSHFKDGSCPCTAVLPLSMWILGACGGRGAMTAVASSHLPNLSQNLVYIRPRQAGMSILGIVFDIFCYSKGNLYCLLTRSNVFIVSHCAMYFVHHQSGSCKIAAAQNPSICYTFHAWMVGAGQDRPKTRSPTCVWDMSVAARSMAACSTWHCSCIST